jgi:hypothetical protein
MIKYDHWNGESQYGQNFHKQSHYPLLATQNLCFQEVSSDGLRSSKINLQAVI